MTQKIYQVDAFTDKVFSGNSAAVCPLEHWPDEDTMQKIAMENNLAETAFYVRKDDHYEIRWFTPSVEVDLCGHATLAAAYVLFNHEGHNDPVINFYSERSGKLSVTKEGEFLFLNFPADVFKQADLTDELIDCFDIRPVAAFKGKTDYMLVFDNEDQIRNISPSLINISKTDARGIIITAKGSESDFVSRFFGPQSGIDEDPVTGSAHTTLTPYWSEILDKKELTAIQLSSRRGYLRCRDLGERIEISGEAKLYMKGEILL